MKPPAVFCFQEHFEHINDQIDVLLRSSKVSDKTRKSDSNKLFVNILVSAESCEETDIHGKRSNQGVEQTYFLCLRRI